jgi:hypothetical protein
VINVLLHRSLGFRFVLPSCLQLIISAGEVDVRYADDSTDVVMTTVVAVAGTCLP